MQKDSHGRLNNYSSLGSSCLFKSDGYNYTSPHTSVLLSNPNFKSPDILSTYTSSSIDNSGPPQYLLAEHQRDTMKRQNWCLSRLCETTKEAEALRQENINLQFANNKLNKQFNNLLMLQSSSLQNSHVSPAHEYINAAPSSVALSSPSLIDGFQGMHISKKPAAWNDESGDGENLVVKRVSLPKSISIRSNGYLKTVKESESRIRGGGDVQLPNRVKPVKAAPRVHVSGGKKEEKPLELHAYNQGVTKTELCNQWQQTGVCPYGSNCQFAHGIEELRPVLRHHI